MLSSAPTSEPEANDERASSAPATAARATSEGEARAGHNGVDGAGGEASARALQPGSLARHVRDQLLPRALTLRLFMVPVLGSLSLAFAFFEPEPWRRVCLGLGVLVFASMSIVEWVRYRRSGLGVVMVPVNVLLTGVGQLALLTGSGGLFSPIVPALLITVFLTAILAERRTLLGLLALLLPSLWALAYAHSQSWPVPSLVPEIFGGPQSIEHGVSPWLAAGVYTAVLSAGARVGSAVQRLFEQLFREAMAERDRSLRLYADQGRTLSLLTSEIAHELKNPLASIKGLAGLVDKDVQGRTAERMAVLRGEVDRMQTVLDEFLNLSRPVLPLSLSPTRLDELLLEVVQLHEGQAAEREVQLRLVARAPLRLHCDARKIRQVLINLVQNALEASPRRGVVRLAVSRDGGQAVLQVSDAGPGLSPEMVARVFEAGATDKEHGSGIGLAVSRALARQHGGELCLSQAPEGGLMAEVRLPLRDGGGPR